MNLTGSLCVRYTLTGDLESTYRPLHNLYSTNELDTKDFRSTKLLFDLKHPVHFQTQVSYDNSTNLIINDNQHKPRLINTYFAPIENDQYLLTPHIGDDNTNVYKEDNLDLNTSLYKLSYKIPKITFSGLEDGGQLQVGSYVFYIKASDEDGNTTDILAESGIIPVTTDSGGYANMRSNKVIHLKISGIDTEYSHVKIYFSRSTSNIHEHAITTCHTLGHLYPLLDDGSCDLIISGLETILDIDESEINTRYAINDYVRSSAIVNSRLFLGNGTVKYADYEMLRDLSRRILPVLNTDKTLENLYKPFYSEPSNVYNYVGYHPYEIYRFGIVYIYANNSVSNVFNVCGVNNLTTTIATDIDNLDIITKKEYEQNEFTNYRTARFLSELDTDKYQPIIQHTLTEDGFQSGDVLNADYVANHPDLLNSELNTRGVCYINPKTDNIQTIYGIDFKFPTYVRAKLKDQGIIGYFFVRQKRISLKLCEFVGTRVFENTYTPAIPTTSSYQYESYTDATNRTIHDYSARIRKPGSSIKGWTYKKSVPNDSSESNFSYKGKYVDENGYWGKYSLTYESDSLQDKTVAGFCPDYEMNIAYFNNLFTGGEYKVMPLEEVTFSGGGSLITGKTVSYQNCGRLRIGSNDNSSQEYNYSNLASANIIGVEDNVSLLSISEDEENYYFSSQVGNQADKFSYKGVGGDYVEACDFKHLANLSDDNGKGGHSNDDTYYTKWTCPNNRIRGIFSPYIGLVMSNPDNYAKRRCIVYPTNFQASSIETYKKMRMLTKGIYYAMGDRYSIDDDIPTQYRGDCYTCQFTHRMNRNFQDATNPSNDIIVSTVGSACPTVCFVKAGSQGKGDSMYGDGSANKCGLVEKDVTGKNVLTNDALDIGVSYKDNCNIGDLNAVQLGTWVSFWIRTDNNYDLRSDDHTNATEKLQMGGWRTSYPQHSLYYGGSHKIKESDAYNFGLSISGGVRQYTCIENDSYDNVYYKNRIFYSNPDITSYFVNGMRIFISNCYQDYDTSYGAITKLISWYGDLLAIFEYGICVIPVNERVTTGEGVGGAVYLNTNKILADTPKVLSPIYGTQWEESVVQTPSYVYGIDTKAKKIWRTNGSQVTIISDFNIQSFLNDNLNLQTIESEIGKTILKAHYVQYKGDVIFTLYKYHSDTNKNVLWSICWNENSDMWTTLYSWIPSYTANLRSTLVSLNYEQTRQMYLNNALKAYTDNIEEGIELTDEEKENYTNIYDTEIKGTSYDGVIEIRETTSDSTDFTNMKSYCYKQDVVLSGDKVHVPKFEKTDGYLVLNNSKLTTQAILLLELLYVKQKNYNSTIINYSDTALQFDNTTIALLNKSEQLEDGIYVMNGTIDDVGESNVLVFDESLKILYYYNDSNITKYELIAFGPKYNIYKHGFSNFVGQTEEIKPTVWYDKLHPFELEFVVIDDPTTNKQFENLKILSNKAEPESFHYEIVGEVYDFAKDKLNAYYRQEKLRNLWHDTYQSQDFAIKYDPYYIELLPRLQQRPLYHIENEEVVINNNYKDEDGNTLYAKSFSPWYYYSRVHNPNQIESYYYDSLVQNYNYDGLAGSEIVWDRRLDDFKLQIHQKGVDIAKPGGILRGNMKYLDNFWNVTIPTIQFKEKNETKWSEKTYTIEQIIDIDSSTLVKIPAGTYQEPPLLPLIAPYVQFKDSEGNISTSSGFNSQEESKADPTLIDTVAREMHLTNKDFDYDKSSWGERQEAAIQDRYMKVRIRYSGRDKVVLQAIKTFYKVTNA